MWGTAGLLNSTTRDYASTRNTSEYVGILRASNQGMVHLLEAHIPRHSSSIFSRRKHIHNAPTGNILHQLKTSRTRVARNPMHGHLPMVRSTSSLMNGMPRHLRIRHSKRKLRLRRGGFLVFSWTPMIMTTSGHNSDAVSEKNANTCLLFAVEPTAISALHQSQTVDTHIRYEKPHDEKA